MAFLKQSDLILEYIAGELLALAKHEGIPVVKVTIQPPRPDDRIFPTNYYRYQFWLDDKFVCSNYYSKESNRWNTGTRSPCKENKDLVAMMEKYFPDGIVDKDTVKKLPTSSIKEGVTMNKNFSERIKKCFGSYSVYNKLNNNEFKKEFTKIVTDEFKNIRNLSFGNYNGDMLVEFVYEKISHDPHNIMYIFENDPISGLGISFLKDDDARDYNWAEASGDFYKDKDDAIRIYGKYFGKLLDLFNKYYN